MMIKKVVATLCAAVLAVGLIGCEELTDLDVVNENAPDKDRALNTPSDVEALIAGGAAVWWDALHNIGPRGAGFASIISTMGDESSSSWGNWGMRDVSSEPRVAWNNSSTYSSEGSLSVPYQNLYGALSAEHDAIIAINDGLVIDDAATTQRALGFAKLIQGLAHGYIAMFFDQANILNEATVVEVAGVPVTLDFVTHQEMMTEAITNLNAAIAIFDANTFTTPSTWFNKLTLTNSDLSKLAHSFIARFMANNARNAAERQAVDWATVKNEIAAGITEEFAPVGDEKGGGGPWYDMQKFQQADATWARADYRTIGGIPNDPETDIDGGYAAWLALPVADRNQYTLNTLDKRVQGNPGVDACVDPEDCDTPTPGSVDAGLDFRFAGVAPFPTNRGTYHFSFYLADRYSYHGVPDGFGPMVHMTPTEMNLLMAEAHLQLGEGGAAALINLTREGRGELTAANDGDADIFSKLYYEKFIEQFNTAAGLAWTERRGAREIAVASSTPGMTLFGLVPGTPRHFPVPGLELEVLQLPTYTFGGSGPDMAPAAAGVRFGVPATAVYQFNPEWTAAEKLQHLINMRKGSGLATYR